MIECSDNTLYTGISTDVSRRYQQHANQKGAKYFRGRQPLRVIYQESGHNRSSASQRERVIKKLSRRYKLELIVSSLNELSLPAI